MHRSAIALADLEQDVLDLDGHWFQERLAGAKVVGAGIRRHDFFRLEADHAVFDGDLARELAAGREDHAGVEFFHAEQVVEVRRDLVAGKVDTDVAALLPRFVFQLGNDVGLVAVAVGDATHVKVIDAVTQDRRAGA